MPVFMSSLHFGHGKLRSCSVIIDYSFAKVRGDWSLRTLRLCVGPSFSQRRKDAKQNSLSLAALAPVVRIPIRFHLELVIEMDVFCFAKLFQAFRAEFAPAA